MSAILAALAKVALHHDIVPWRLYIYIALRYEEHIHDYPETMAANIRIYEKMRDRCSRDSSTIEEDEKQSNLSTEVE